MLKSHRPALSRHSSAHGQEAAERTTLSLCPRPKLFIAQGRAVLWTTLVTWQMSTGHLSSSLLCSLKTAHLLSSWGHQAHSCEIRAKHGAGTLAEVHYRVRVSCKGGVVCCRQVGSVPSGNCEVCDPGNLKSCFCLDSS